MSSIKSRGAHHTRCRVASTLTASFRMSAVGLAVVMLSSVFTTMSAQATDVVLHKVREEHITAARGAFSTSTTFVDTQVCAHISSRTTRAR
eukprot:9251140-Pyramimonas_sp.AAC.2